MARRERPQPGAVTPLRRALVDLRRAHAETWPSVASRTALAALEAAALGGCELVLDGPALCRALDAARDPRWRTYRHNRDATPGGRWLLTADDRIVGPITEDHQQA